MRYVIFLLLILLAGCVRKIDDIDSQRPEPPGSSATNLREATYIYDSTDIVEVTDETVVVLNIDSIYIGSVILGPPCNQAPYGIMRKVTDIVEDGIFYILKTDFAALNEAFSELNIDTVFAEEDSYESDSIAGGSAVRDVFLRNIGISSNVSLNGNFKMNWREKIFKYRLEKPDFLPKYVYYSFPFDSEGTAWELSISGTASTGQKELYKWPLPDFAVWVGLPFPIYFTQSLMLETGPFSVQGKAKFEFKPYVKGAVGFLYENREFSVIRNFDAGIEVVPLKKQNFNITEDVSLSWTLLNLKYALHPFGTEKLELSAEIPATVSYSQNGSKLSYALAASIDLSFAAKMNFFIDELSGETRFTDNLREVKLEGVWGDSLAWYAKNFVPGDWKYEMEFYPGVTRKDDFRELRFDSEAVYNSEKKAWYGKGMLVCEGENFKGAVDVSGYYFVKGCNGELVTYYSDLPPHKMGGKEVIWRLREEEGGIILNWTYKGSEFMSPEDIENELDSPTDMVDVHLQNRALKYNEVWIDDGDLPQDYGKSYEVRVSKTR